MSEDEARGVIRGLATHVLVFRHPRPVACDEAVKSHSLPVLQHHCNLPHAGHQHSTTRIYGQSGWSHGWSVFNDRFSLSYYCAPVARAFALDDGIQIDSFEAVLLYSSAILVQDHFWIHSQGDSGCWRQDHRAHARQPDARGRGCTHGGRLHVALCEPVTKHSDVVAEVDRRLARRKTLDNASTDCPSPNSEAPSRPKPSELAVEALQPAVPGS